MKIVEVFKSLTEEERRKNVTDVIVSLESSRHHRDEAYMTCEKIDDEIV